MRRIRGDSSDSDLEKILDEGGTDVLVVAHTHVPFVRRLRDGRIVASPGALLRDPAPGVEIATRGTFAVVDVSTREVTVQLAKDGAILHTYAEPCAAREQVRSPELGSPVSSPGL